MDYTLRGSITAIPTFSRATEVGFSEPATDACNYVFRVRPHDGMHSGVLTRVGCRREEDAASRDVLFYREVEDQVGETPRARRRRRGPESGKIGAQYTLNSSPRGAVFSSADVG